LQKDINKANFYQESSRERKSKMQLEVKRT